jgi:hypothetical protein
MHAEFWWGNTLVNRNMEDQLYGRILIKQQLGRPRTWGHNIKINGL